MYYTRITHALHIIYNMSTRLPTITCIYDRYSKATARRKATVEIRITYNRRQKYISTGIYLYPRQWKNGTIVNTPDAAGLNNALDRMISSIRTILSDMTLEGNIDIYSIPQRLQQQTSEQSFIDFCRQRAEIRKYGKAPGSQKRYDKFIRFFTAWGRIRSFNDITEANIILYDRHLGSMGMKASSKWNNYHRFLNSFILDAIEEGLVVRNPYRKLNIEKEKYIHSLEKCLTLEEFHKIRDCIIPCPGVANARDVFVFQTYTCLSYTDIRSLEVRNIATVNDMPVYIGKRTKTGKPFTIPILKPAMDILERYSYRLPVVSNATYNYNLKRVAVYAGIDKPISSHWARHTGATLLLNEGVDMQIIARICGHSSIKITEEIYAKVIDETVVKALEGIEI